MGSTSRIFGVAVVFIGNVFAVAFAASTAAGATVPSIEVGTIVVIMVMIVIGLLMLMVLVLLLLVAVASVAVVVIIIGSGGGGVANVNTSSVHHVYIGYAASKVLDPGRNVRAKGSTGRGTSFRSRRVSGHGRCSLVVAVHHCRKR